ncbi:acyltransferase family protein [Fluviispira multicolorata]|uniref:Acyltransferase family protein n=1 Tax=Fluviispira multicolorata TaxID=2654512 RepID=A0A833JD59_9BACT|nr:acyltransferase [Fluviispira multicolorata]KAB8028032.1 hypothetical protein GCL57_13340 [Fluviispira multicolorata]
MGIIFINKDSNFPGWVAIYPTLGAALIILSGSNAFINKNFLSNKIAVCLGKMSYPLYLWHWPLLSFAWIFNIEGDPSRNMRFMIVMVSFILAFLTYKYLEKPMRHLKYTTKSVVTVLVVLYFSL